MSIRQDVLDAKLLETFRTALTPGMIDYLVNATNEVLAHIHGEVPAQIEALIDERQRLEKELSNLIDLVAKGEGSSPRLRDEISNREQRLTELDRTLELHRSRAVPAPRQIDRHWIEG
jgi:predicted nuclease with TOPRIM domain